MDVHLVRSSRFGSRQKKRVLIVTEN